MPPESSQKKPLFAGESLASRGEESSTLRLAGSTPLNASPLALGAPPTAPAVLNSPAGAAKPGKTINGTPKVDTLVGGSGNQTLRGKGANDTLWGDKTDGSKGGSDTFVFEKSLAYNGLDTIRDYHWSADNSDGLGQDVLDLTAALKSFKYALKTNPNANITDYVRLEPGSGGMNLMVDTDGAGGKSAEQWAFLEGLTASDPVRVRAFTASGSGSGSGQNLGDGYYTLGGEAPLPDYITVGRDGMWFDTNEDGQRNGDETLLAVNGPDGDGYYTINDDEFVGFANLDYTVRFVDAKTPYPLDLTGFGAGDKIILDGKTNAASWYGVEATIRSLAGIPSSVPTGRIYQTYSKSGNTSSDFGIYAFRKSAGGYIYNTSGIFAYKTKNGASGTFAFGSTSYYAYLSLLGSKVFGAASTNTKPIPLAKGLPTSDPWPGYALEVIKPSGTIVTA